MDWQYFATLTGLFLALDLLVWFAKRRDYREWTAASDKYDAESERRHIEFMEAIAEDRRERMRNT